MVKILNFANRILDFLIFLDLACAFFYLICWCAIVFDVNLFGNLNNIFALLPLIIDKIFYYEIDIMGKDISMGYVYSALSFAIVSFFLLQLKKKLKQLKNKFEIKKQDCIKSEKDNTDLIQKQKEDMMKAKISYIETYFGLFEFNLEYFDKNCSQKIDFEKLKVEYSKLIINKLKTKYKNVNFIDLDKVFFFSKDFSTLNFIVEDMINLFHVFFEINSKKYIKTDMLMSFWCDDRKNKPKEVLKILEKMNFLRYLNQIIVPYKFTERCKQEGIKYKFIPQGISWLDIQDDEDSNIEIELFSMKKN